MSELKGVHLTERTIPVPNSISPEAQAALAMERPIQPPFPPTHDKAGWHARIDMMNSGMAEMSDLDAEDALRIRSIFKHFLAIAQP